MTMRWKIWYSDGSTFSDADGTPDEAPKSGVQVIHVADGRCGRRVLKLVDYYVWAPSLSRWLDCVDSASAILRMSREAWSIILRGEYLLEADFEKILIASHEDNYIPSVSPGDPPHEAWRK